ncbi:hypothetical protein [Salinicoccus kekensis]|uniref:Uncharacterized protein n=1 Tax=Salinicoccus kekensis TaxID=714307 RepID=A0A285U8L0_9STAP|nr:hypothetical protein [Salinicoccus kekensis]SOC38264.1 hypothetical protein SAMN05878391_0354 [Salinicoccus kekensis]
MRLIFFSIISLLILSSCQSNENPEETADDAEETTIESSIGSTNNEMPEETTSNEQSETNESSEEPAEENKNSENEEEEKESTDEANDNMSDENATLFDIHSDEVQQALFSSSSVEEDNLTFSQDVITQGMSQTEVEERYGTYDLIYPGHGGPVVIYGNLGVNYSETFPYGTNDEQADEDINPDENIVEDVKFYAGLPYDEVVNALGEPDIDVYETEGGPVSGLQLMEYVIEDKENSTLTGTFWLHDNESGEKTVDLMTIDEVPDDAEEITAQHPEESEGIDAEDEERIESFINGYIDDLMAYYNDGNEDILTRTGETSPNYEKISANRASGNYDNHETYDTEIIDITNVEGNEYEVTVSREYSHVTSNGRSVTEVEYSTVETPQGFKIFDYQELDNESIE